MATAQGSKPGVGPWRAGAVDGFDEFPDEAMEHSITDRFFDVAGQHPESLALSSPAGKLTFSELASRVRSLAGGVLDHDGPDPRPVAVLAAHDGPLVAAILGVIAAGKIVVIMDPTVSAEDHDHVIRESGASTLLVDEANRDTANAIAGRNDITVHDLDAGEGSVDELPQRGADSPAMLAFTSGTSGSSKGGIITHGVILNVVRGATNALGVTPDDRMPMLFPVSLAVASYPMFIPLLVGGTLATLDVRGVGLAPVGDFLIDERITLAYMAPTVIRFLVDAVAGKEFPDLRMIALGGELVDSEVVALTNDLFSPELMANGFGTTETGVITLYVIDPGESFEGTVPSGYPVEDVELTILDDNGEPVGTGESGEIAATSPYVFTGYWGHDELNTMVLAPDGSGRDGWQTYRTGDLGRLDDNGAVTVLGRVDTKVKIRGRFVVLGDVEAAIRELDGIDDAAVVAVERDRHRELRAVVVPSVAVDPATAEGGGGSDQTTRTALDPQHLRAAMLETQEAYRVPAHWEFVEELPRLPNGKLDRRALSTVEGIEPPRPGSLFDESAGDVTGAAATGTTPAGGADHVERELRDLWELLLPVEVVSLDDDFTHLGGDSLLAAQMLVMAEERLGVRIPMGELVHARTVRQLARVVRDTMASTTSTTVSCVQEGDPSTRPRLWFVHDLQGSAYRVRHVARELGADQPVWSFESPLLAGEPNRFSSLAMFAANYVTDLLEVQPEGPYWLAGYSFGGVCAYEMARQLARQGHEVAFVGIADVGRSYRGPGWGNKRPPLRPWFGVRKPAEPDSPLGERVRYYVDMVKESPAVAARHWMVRSGLHQFIDPMRYRSDLKKHGRVRPEWRLWYAWDEHWRLAVKEWDRSNTYDGEVDLFWASQSASADASMGWEPLVGELNIHRFEGDHLGALEPRGAEALARVVRQVIDERIESRGSTEG